MRERMAGEFYGLRGRLLALEKAYNHGREGRLTVTGDTIQSFPQLQHTTHREFSTRMDARDLEPILDKVRPFVMPPVSIQALVDLANVVLMVLACDIAKCGSSTRSKGCRRSKRSTDPGRWRMPSTRPIRCTSAIPECPSRTCKRRPGNSGWPVTASSSRAGSNRRCP